ncbi:ABC transporter permease [Brevibacterium sp. 50QC2O2]|jgi:peptide/nickel transport system permease protein|uniref:ABC transporter permease n=1 Tax=unclassified Brevibacterium TaxID=2614124 RepID=UPI00211CC14B|nr:MULTISPECIES: ABC transporter permease [unclassified Brevibacterium]MCQ9368764.1 ABC transporter permease [Brevibacterium sp. 91QC2O2]MCQ9389746.1 ABC transporter permease [Brevibacterium sp. 50QC2O2]
MSDVVRTTNPLPTGPGASAGAVARKPAPSFVKWASIVILAGAVLLLVAGRFITPYDPNKQDLTSVFSGPSPAHWLGTDDLGRDVLSRMLVGGQATILASLFAVALALVLGLVVGILAGYLGGWVDVVLMRVVDAFLAFPAIVLAIGVTATMGIGLFNAMFAVGIVLAPGIARLARAQTLSVKESTYIEAARSYGARGFRRMVLPHIVPNMIQPVVVQTAVIFGHAMIAEASLSFLSLGVQPPESSWGAVLSRAYAFMSQAPYAIIIPGVAIALMVFAVNIMADEVQTWLDPKRRK